MSCCAEEICQLLQAGADPLVGGQSGESAFEVSVYYAVDPSRHEEKMAFQKITKMFLEKLRPAGLTWFKRLNTQGLSPLCWAAFHNAIDVMHYLLDIGVNVNQMSYLGMTPLHFSAGMNRREACKLLLAQADIEVEKKDHHGATAIHHAAKNGAITVLNQLLSVPFVDLSRQDVHGNTAIWWATHNCRGEVAERLLDECAGRHIGVEVIGHDPHMMKSSSVLHNAVRYCSLVVVRRLLAERINLNEVVGGQTPFCVAVEQGDLSLVQDFLCDPSIDINLCSSPVLSPLGIAIKRRDFKMVQLLFRQGKRLNVELQMGI